MSLDGWFNFSLILEINTRYGFTNVSDIQDLKRAYPLLDMVDRDTRYNNANVCAVKLLFLLYDNVIINKTNYSLIFKDLYHYKTVSPYQGHSNS